MVASRPAFARARTNCARQSPGTRCVFCRLFRDPHRSRTPQANHAAVIGLFASPERLQQIRTSRLHSLREKRATNYIDIEILKKEIEEAKKICSRNKWSTIDVTKKSIEEIAATALEYLKIFKSKAL